MSFFEKQMQQIAQFLMILDIRAAFETIDHSIWIWTP